LGGGGLYSTAGSSTASAKPVFFRRTARLTAGLLLLLLGLDLLRLRDLAMYGEVIFMRLCIFH
jgi:hypothetical protein